MANTSHRALRQLRGLHKGALINIPRYFSGKLYDNCRTFAASPKSPSGMWASVASDATAQGDPTVLWCRQKFLTCSPSTWMPALQNMYFTTEKGSNICSSTISYPHAILGAAIGARKLTVSWVRYKTQHHTVSVFIVHQWINVFQAAIGTLNILQKSRDRFQIE